MPITGLRETVVEYASAVVQTAAEAYLADAVLAAPEDTGELKRSARGPELSLVGEGILRAVVGFDAPQAEYTDRGTPPHVIRAVHARSLRFFWDSGPNGAGWYSFDSVNNPGITGTGWFSEMEDLWENYVQAACEGGVIWAPPISSLAS